MLPKIEIPSEGSANYAWGFLRKVHPSILRRKKRAKLNNWGWPLSEICRVMKRLPILCLSFSSSTLNFIWREYNPHVYSTLFTHSTACTRKAFSSSIHGWNRNLIIWMMNKKGQRAKRGCRSYSRNILNTSISSFYLQMRDQTNSPEVRRKLLNKILCGRNWNKEDWDELKKL